MKLIELQRSKINKMIEDFELQRQLQVIDILNGHHKKVTYLLYHKALKNEQA